MITLKDTNAFIKRAYIKNSYLVGTFEIGDDGYWYYCFPDVNNGGLVASFILKELADKLDELNEPWDKIVEQGLRPRAGSGELG